MLSGKTSDTLMPLINIQYILFYLKKWVILSGKTSDTLMRLINIKYILFYFKK